MKKIKLPDSIGDKYYNSNLKTVTEEVNRKIYTGRVVKEHPEFDVALVDGAHYYGDIDYYLEVNEKLPYNWYDYHHHNKQGESDCQLVTACNVLYHLTGAIIDQDSELYEEMKKDCGCVAGSCINIKKAWKRLGIKVDKTYKIWELDKLLKQKCLFEISVWHKFFGCHSITAIDYVKRCDVLRVTNFKHVASVEGWIFIEDLKPHFNNNPNKKDWYFRTFKSIN